MSHCQQTGRVKRLTFGILITLLPRLFTFSALFNYPAHWAGCAVRGPRAEKAPGVNIKLLLHTPTGLRLTEHSEFIRTLLGVSDEIMNLIGLEMCYPWAGMSDCIRQPSAISLNCTVGGTVPDVPCGAKISAPYSGNISHDLYLYPVCIISRFEKT